MPTDDGDIYRFRSYLFGLAYRMLGSASEAEDMVQDAYERWYQRPELEVTAPRAFLTRVVIRLCLDHLKSARKKRELYVGQWLPEPVLTQSNAFMAEGDLSIESAEAELLRAETISAALLIALERLSPQERAVHLLREVFDYSHAEVAEILGKSEAACRQIQARARKAMAAEKPRFAANNDDHQRLLDGFMTACVEGDVPGLISLFNENITATSDGGGKAHATLQVLTGRHAIARFYIGLAKGLNGHVASHIHQINGHPALVLTTGNTLHSVMQITVDNGLITHVGSMLNPDKLGHLAKALGFQLAH